MSLMDRVESTLKPLANVVGNNKYLLTLRDTFITTMPLMIIGSLFMLAANFPIEAWTDYAAATQVGGMSISDILLVPYYAAVALVALFTAFIIGYRYAEHDGLDDRASAGIVSLLAWLILLPFSISFTPDGSTETFAVQGLPLDWLGSKGILVAVLAGFFSMKVYGALVHRNVIIKMPAGVPPTVARSFSALIPAAAVVLCMMVLRIAFLLTPWGDAFNFIFSVLQTPLQGLGGSLPAYLIVRLVAQTLWMFGLHGTSITGAVYDPISLSLSIENQEAVAAGLAPMNIINQQFGSLFVCIGGDGMILCLVLAMLIATRSKRSKRLGELALTPALFNISEPVMFGLPVVLNPLMFVPFVFVPVICAALTYAVMALGLVPICNGALVPWTCPPIISGFLVSGWQGAVWQVVLIALGTAIYLPFIRVADRQFCQEEEHAANRHDELDDLDLDALDMSDL